MNRKIWLPIMAFFLLATACGIFDEVDQAFEDEVEPIATPEEGLESFPDESFEDTEGLNASTEATDCLFGEPAGYDISCGVLTVPENRTRPDSPSIQISYAIVHAAEEEGRPPIVYLAGGPGGSGIDDFVSDPEGWNYPFTRNRDLILIDQRGTGYSQPTLDCPELAEEVDFLDENPEVVCHDRLVAEGIDLAAYNTAENAADVAALQQALDIASWDLLGISYGTRLALNIMRDYPDGVRSAVLDSVFPPNADTPADEGLTPYWSLQQLFSDCARDAYCNENYPDLESVFLETVEALNETPEEGVYGDDLVFAVTNALNATDLIPLVPYVIYEAYYGNMGALDEISDDSGGSNRQRFQDGEDRSDSEGMYNSVICHEEYVFGDYGAAEARVVGEVPEALEAALLQPVADLFHVCSYWGAGTAGAVENEPVFSDIPTLILAGQYDHATPPAWAYLAAETLSNAYVYEFPGAGHSLLGGVTCAISITANFLEAPSEEPESGCIDGVEWPYFE